MGTRSPREPRLDPQVIIVKKSHEKFFKQKRFCALFSRALAKNPPSFFCTITIIESLIITIIIIVIVVAIVYNHSNRIAKKGESGTLFLKQEFRKVCEVSPLEINENLCVFFSSFPFPDHLCLRNQNDDVFFVPNSCFVCVCSLVRLFWRQSGRGLSSMIGMISLDGPRRLAVGVE